MDQMQNLCHSLIKQKKTNRELHQLAEKRKIKIPRHLPRGFKINLRKEYNRTIQNSEWILLFSR